MKYYLPNWLRIALLIGLFVFLIGLFVANYSFVRQSPGGNDFLARWTGAHYWLVEGVNPYDEDDIYESYYLIHIICYPPTGLFLSICHISR